MSLTRPKMLREVEVLARIHTVRAVEVLAEVMEDKTAPPGARISAANSILDRGWGRAPQSIVVEEGIPEHMSDERLEDYVNERIALIAAGATRARQEGSGADGGAPGASSKKGPDKPSGMVH